MSGSSKCHKDALVHHLASLYGRSQGETTATEVQSLCEHYQSKLAGRPLKAKLSERDVLLITYGDTLEEEGVPPLQVLLRFHNEKLQHAFELVHVLPFHPFTSDDGFSVTDYHAVREDLGTWDDIEDLANECDVMADAVINHMSSEAPWFKAFLAGDREFKEFFFEADPQQDLSAVVRPRTTPLLTKFKDRSGKDRHLWTTFSADQVDLNYQNPSVFVTIINVLFFLILKGARLLRLDAVTFLWKKPGTSSANLPETHAIIKAIRAAVALLREDVVLITETNVPHRENIAYFGDGHDEAHMAYNFALPPLLAHSFIEGNATHLSNWASQLDLPSSEVCFLNFSASHDGVGVRPVEEILPSDALQKLVQASLNARGLVSSRTLTDGKEHPYELNCTYLDLISRPEDDDSTRVERFLASQSIVLSMPGVPAIYIQSLLGTRNDLARVQETGRARSINRSHHAYADVIHRIEDKASLESRIFHGLLNLIERRRELQAFNPFTPFEILDLGSKVFAINRGGETHSVTCITNMTETPVTVTVPDHRQGFDVLSEQTINAQHTLNPYGIVWIRTNEK